MAPMNRTGHVGPPPPRHPARAGVKLHPLLPKSSRDSVGIYPSQGGRGHPAAQHRGR